MSNAFEKSSKIESIFSPLFNDFARSWTLFINWVSLDRFDWNQRWASVIMLLWCKCSIILLWIIHSNILQDTDVNDIGL